MVSCGFETTQAMDGEAAYHLICRQRFDLTLIDIIMPKMDGLTVLEKLKADNNPLNKNMKFIVLSSIKNEADIARAYAAGASDYVTKPFSLLELEAKANRLVNNK